MSKDERHAAKFGLVAPAPTRNLTRGSSRPRSRTRRCWMRWTTTRRVRRRRTPRRRRPREKLKVGSVKLFRKSNAKKKDEGEKDWADEQEARLSRTKLPEAVKAA